MMMSKLQKRYVARIVQNNLTKDAQFKRATLRKLSFLGAMRSIGARCTLTCFLVFSNSIVWAAAPTSIEQLKSFGVQVTAAEGTFTQRTLGAQGQTAPDQAGTFIFERPGRFLWQVTQPYEQLILTDGKDLYQYDPDLSQVTVRSVGNSLGDSPAAVLFGNGQIDDLFTLSPLPDQEGLAWLRAVPKQPDSGLRQIDMGLRDGLPVKLLLKDGFGQMTQVDITTLKPKTSLPADTFKFELPPHTDLVRLQ
jgi:outer membrane lipoprotein carrier protein